MVGAITTNSLSSMYVGSVVLLQLAPILKLALAPTTVNLHSTYLLQATLPHHLLEYQHPLQCHNVSVNFLYVYQEKAFKNYSDE
jgi:hypothetical protein